MRNADQFDEWITSARTRLAARKNGRPSTKVGAVRALWPEIQQALRSGQTLKTIRDWLEVEGVSLQYNQLATYVRRIRRTPARWNALPPPDVRGAKDLPLGANRQASPLDASPSPGQSGTARDPLANLRARQGTRRTFEYNPDFKEEDLL